MQRYLRLRFPAWLLLVFSLVTGSCDSGGDEPGEDRLLSVRMGEQQRTFILYIPARYDAQDGSPLLIAFHGTPGNGPGMRISTGLDEIADSKGWLIAYPNGLNGEWAAGCLCSNADLAGVDDLRFVTQMIGRIKNEYTVDPERIYSVGFSAGGIMNYRVACDLGETFAAAASVASSMTWAQVESCEPSRPVPVFAMLGTDDQAFPWQGSGLVAGHSMPIDSTFSFWSHRNQCSAIAQSDYEAPKEAGLDVRRDRYSGCAANSEVIRYVIEGGTHLWPKTANGALLAFFERH